MNWAAPYLQALEYEPLKAVSLWAGCPGTEISLTLIRKSDILYICPHACGSLFALYQWSCV